MDKIYLSVVIPSYNEMTNLRKGVLDRVEHFLKRQKFNYEVIVVDDGSDDGSIEYVERFIKESPEFRIIKIEHLGKAGAVTAGMLSAKGEYVLFTDMDQATPIEEVSNLLPFTKKFDIVIGSRNSQRKGAPWTRLLMAKGMMVLRSIVVGVRGINDTQCGFKLFRKDASDDLFSKIKTLHRGYTKIHGSSVKAGFDVELLYLAEKMGYKIKEVAVEWLYVESRRVSPIKDSIEAVQDLVRIRMNSLSGKYNNL
ncbi:MAG: glycosyltransferase [Candidatus Levybacteria bacterium]|nr:glycosyltransferase [Candidatus Levybacteria bacterium]